jgi:L-asparaginase II
MKSEIIAKVTRGGTLESVHRGTLIVMTGDGKKVAEIGDSSAVTFWRSAAKAVQAIPFLTSGAADEYGFTDKEIALACASHSGEPFHIKLAEKMLRRSGSDETDLRCGAHLPMHEQSAHALLRAGQKENQLHNNCSGKHAAMIAFAKHIGADPETYLSRENPVQKAILETISLFTGISPDEIKIGIDGCSAPNFAIPLRAMALSYAKLIRPEDYFAREESKNRRKKVSLIEACQRIVSAKMKQTEYVGGSVRLDSKIMKALPGQIVCKVGAEGIWSAGILPCKRWPQGLAIALKIEDGNDYRARPVVAVELLKQLGILNDKATKDLAEFAPMVLKNRMEKNVGEVFADFEIKT